MKILFFILFAGVVAGCTGTTFTQGGDTPATALQKECMERVLRMDSTMGAGRNRASRKMPLSQAIRDYVRGIEAIDFRGCPAAFTGAFTRHKEAWKGLLPITDKYPRLRGELHQLFGQLEKGPHAEDFKRRLGAVWDTWAEVEKSRNNP